MNLIVNVDQNWAIGHKGKLLVSIPEDMKFFRSETSGKSRGSWKKDTGYVSGRNAIKEPDQHYSDQKP